MAEIDWLYAFMKRNPDISLRKPEPTSLARAMEFNKPQVKRFYDLLGDIMDHEKLEACKMFNVDETGLSTVQKTQRILATKGKKSVGCLTSAERGTHTTAVCAMSAAGQLVPPMLIFARKRMKDELVDGGPPGSIGRCRDSGYIDKDLFLEYLQHFVSQVKCSKEHKVLLILDGHTSHTKSIAVIDFARDNGIILMSLPPHTTHRLQPLDTSLFKSVESYYDEAIRQWLRNHPGSAVTIWQVAGLFAEAYGRAATIQTAVNGFRSTGIGGIFANNCDSDVSNPRRRLLDTSNTIGQI